jgi:rhomboid protease GluP
MTIIAVTIAVWIGHLLIQKLAGVNTDNTLAGNGLLGTDGQWWRLITPLVVHFSFVHIAFNMAWLYQLGPAIERIMGRVGFVATYLATGLAGNVCSDAVYYHRANFLSGGASGSVYGLGGVLIGAWLVGRQLDRRRVGPPPSGALLFNDEVVRSLAILFGAYLVMTVVFLRGVDTAAHFGGGLLGLAIGAALAWRRNGPHAKVTTT